MARTEIFISPAELHDGWEQKPEILVPAEWFDREHIWYKHCSKGLLRLRQAAVTQRKEYRVVPADPRAVVERNYSSPLQLAWAVRPGQWRRVTVAVTPETIAAQVLFELSRKHPDLDWREFRRTHWKAVVEAARREMLPAF